MRVQLQPLGEACGMGGLQRHPGRVPRFIKKALESKARIKRLKQKAQLFED